MHVLTGATPLGSLSADTPYGAAAANLATPTPGAIAAAAAAAAAGGPDMTPELAQRCVLQYY